MRKLYIENHCFRLFSYGWLCCFVVLIIACLLYYIVNEYLMSNTDSYNYGSQL
jgi:YbbR domain-containing protein